MTTSGLVLSEFHMHSAVETYLHSMRLIEDAQTIQKIEREFNTDTQVHEYLVTLQKETLVS